MKIPKDVDVMKTNNAVIAPENERSEKIRTISKRINRIVIEIFE